MASGKTGEPAARFDVPLGDGQKILDIFIFCMFNMII